jgi:hypothetical protein
MTRSALDALVSCANVGYEGLEGNLADIDDVGDLLDKIGSLLGDDAMNVIQVHQTNGECNVFNAGEDEFVTRGFDEAYAKYEETGDERLRTVI